MEFRKHPKTDILVKSLSVLAHDSHSFDDIQISKLCEHAGVSTSLLRRYNYSIYALLENYEEECAKKFAEVVRRLARWDKTKMKSEIRRIVQEDVAIFQISLDTYSFRLWKKIYSYLPINLILPEDGDKYPDKLLKLTGYFFCGYIGLIDIVYDKDGLLEEKEVEKIVDCISGFAEMLYAKD